ncbi:MAG: hypothetical protein ISR58_10280 [Anaerolineales bacterium]|nr:hypothetical protein [Chloroflexota bacterium]MBL6981560.1 hypothetical protein [Anaerolineales bacterium]
MTQKNWNSDKPIHKSEISINEVNRVLDVGKLLRSVLSQQELEQFQRILQEHQHKSIQQPSILREKHLGEIGNTGIT